MKYQQIIALNSNLPLRWTNEKLEKGLPLKTSRAVLEEFMSSNTDSVGEDILTPIEQMMLQWNNTLSDYSFFQIPSEIVEDNKGHYKTMREYNEDQEMGIYLHDEWFAQEGISHLTLAVTLYHGRRQNMGTANEWVKLVNVDIVINGRHSFTRDKEAHFLAFDFDSVILHELGHFVGLFHENSKSDSVMRPSLPPNIRRREISSLDGENLRKIYPDPIHASEEALKDDRDFRTSFSETKEREEEEQEEQYEQKGQEGREKEQKSEQSEESDIYGVIELRSDGTCLHYENNKLIFKHYKN